MVRHVIAALVVLCVSASWARAQENVLTITAASATVHKSPSDASPVIGRAAKGQALDVTRDVGDWLKIAWPLDPSGVGYVRENTGARGRQTAAGQAAVGAPSTMAARASEPARRTELTSAEPLASADTTERPRIGRSTPPSTYVARPSHIVGLGGRMQGPSLGVGASLRAWSPGWLGVQLEVSRYSVTVPLDPNRMTTTQFAPSVLFTPTDMLSDYVWLRPYAGTGLSLYRSTLATPVVGASVSDSQIGFQAFAGAEFTAASLPSLGISVDYGYRRFSSPFVGFDLGGTSFAVAGHWYVK